MAFENGLVDLVCSGWRGRRSVGPRLRLGVFLCLLLAGVAPGPAGAAGKNDPVRAAAMALARVDSVLVRGELEEGIRLAEEAVSRFADDPRLIDPLENRLALALMQLGRHTEALPLLENAVLRRPGHGPAHRNLGACLQALGRRGRALSEYQEFVQLEPRNYLAHLEFGQVLLEFRMHEQAEQELRIASGLCGQCPRVDPALATALLGGGKPGEALVPLRRLIAGPRPEAFHRHYLKAMLESGADEELIGYLGSRTQPVAADEVRLLVEAEGRQGRARWSGALLREAEGSASSGLVLAEGWGDDPLLWARLSLNLQQAENDAGALAAIDRAIARDPDSALLRNNRVVLLQNLGRMEEARAEWRRAVALDPSLERK